MQKQSGNTTDFNAMGLTVTGQFEWLDRGKRTVSMVLLPIVGDANPVKVVASRQDTKGLVAGQGLYHFAVMNGELIMPPTVLAPPALNAGA